MTTSFPFRNTHEHKSQILGTAPKRLRNKANTLAPMLSREQQLLLQTRAVLARHALPTERASMVRARLDPLREAAGTCIESAAAFGNHTLRSLDDVHVDEASLVRHYVFSGVSFQIELGNCLRKLTL